jgi:hypothetical protein
MEKLHRTLQFDPGSLRLVAPEGLAGRVGKSASAGSVGACGTRRSDSCGLPSWSLLLPSQLYPR